MFETFFTCKALDSMDAHGREVAFLRKNKIVLEVNAAISGRGRVVPMSKV